MDEYPQVCVSIANTDVQSHINRFCSVLKKISKSVQLQLIGRSQNEDLSEEFLLSHIKNDKNVKENVDSNDPEEILLNEYIEELISLYKRIEADTSETSEIYTKECLRCQTLSYQIHESAKKRLVDLPLAVQNVHEACLADLNALKRRVVYLENAEKRISNDVKKAEKFKLELEDAIDRDNRNSSCVNEKLLLEDEAVLQIERAQKETDEELEIMREHLKKKENKREEANDSASKERLNIAKELQESENSLQQSCKKLKEAESTFEGYNQEYQGSSIQLEENTNELVDISMKHENTLLAKNLQHAKILELQKKISDQADEQKKNEDSVAKYQFELDTLRQKYSNIESGLNDVIQKNEDKLKELSQNNTNFKIDVDSLSFHITKHKQEIVDAKKNKTKVMKEITTVGEQNDSIDTKLFNVRVVNRSTSEKYSKMKEENFDIEDKLKNTLDSLKKQTIDEIHSKKVMRNHIETDAKEYKMNSDDTSLEKDKLVRKLEEVNKTVAAITEKVQKLQEKNLKREMLISQLQNQITKSVEEKISTMKKKEEYSTEMQTIYDKLIIDIESFNNNLEMMQKKSDQMNQNMEDMARTSLIMNPSMNKMIESNDISQNELDQLKMSVNCCDRSINSIQLDLKKTEARITDSQEKHNAIVVKQKENLEQNKEYYAESLKLNSDLSKKYRKLQNDVFDAKSIYLTQQELKHEKVCDNEDMIETMKLQHLLYDAMQNYQMQHNLVTNAHVNHLHFNSANNVSQIRTVNSRINETLKRISDFLNGASDDNELQSSIKQEISRIFSNDFLNGDVHFAVS